MIKKNIPFFYNKAPIDFINSFEKNKVGVFRKPKSSLDGIDKVLFSVNKKEFRVEFDFNQFFRREKNLGVGKQIKKVKFEFNEKTIILNNIFIDKFSNQSLEGSINQIQSEGFSK